MSMESTLNSIVTSIKEDMSKSTNTVYQGLVVEQPRGRLPENIFVSYFLPRFMGTITDNNWVMEWISVAGSPMGEIDVFKDYTNDVLFTVPPLLSTNTLIISTNSVNMSDVFTRYEQLNNNLPVLGTNFFQDALRHKSSELINSVSLKEVNDRWISILTRYNMVQSPTTSQDSTLEDFFE